MDPIKPKSKEDNTTNLNIFFHGKNNCSGGIQTHTILLTRKNALPAALLKQFSLLGQTKAVFMLYSVPCMSVLDCTRTVIDAYYTYLILLHYTVLYLILLYCTVLYCTVLYCATSYFAALYCTIPYDVNVLQYNSGGK